MRRHELSDRDGHLIEPHTLGQPGTRGEQGAITVSLSPPSSTVPAPVLPGVTCPLGVASGTALPAVFGAGRWQGGKQFFSRSMPGFVDSTTVKAHQAAAGQKSTARRECFGRSCGGLGTKVHVVVDALGNCLHLALTPAASTESPQRPALLAALAQPPGAIVCAKAYDTNNGLNTITDQRAVPVIPPKSTG